MMRVLAALAALLFAAAAHADSWVTPTVREVFSASRDHFVRVTPGVSWGDTVGFKGAATGRYAEATWYARAADGSYKPAATVTLPNPVAPVEFFVADDGRVVTLDNWHNRGYGVAVAVYPADGKAIASYKLADLFTEKEVEAFSPSVSSIHWHGRFVNILDNLQEFLGSFLLFGHPSKWLVSLFSLECVRWIRRIL